MVSTRLYLITSDEVDIIFEDIGMEHDLEQILRPKESIGER